MQKINRTTPSHDTGQIEIPVWWANFPTLPETKGKAPHETPGGGHWQWPTGLATGNGACAEGENDCEVRDSHAPREKERKMSRDARE